MRKLLPGLAVAAPTTTLVATPAHAEATVRHAGSPTAVPGSSIVKLEDPAVATGFVSGVAVRFLRLDPTATSALVQTELTRRGPVPWCGRLPHWSPTR